MTSNPTAIMTPQEIAEKVKHEMFSNDHASKGLGVSVVAIAPGYAKLKMEVVQSMINGHGGCHGGFITTLADSAFAFACNSRNELTVASGLSIDFVSPAAKGDVLFAEATEIAKASRLGVYDIAVRNQNGGLVATMRGKSYTIKGKQVVAL